MRHTLFIIITHFGCDENLLCSDIKWVWFNPFTAVDETIMQCEETYPFNQENNKLSKYLFYSWKFHDQKADKIGTGLPKITVHI
jgi:hypothetical protein